MTIVICVRDPDASNEFFVHETPTLVIDVDFGRADLGDPAELDEWLTALRDEAAAIASFSPGAAERLHNIADEAEFNFDQRRED